ncbi:MAG TPA: hypothetical protein PKI05_15625, partial [Thermogutta sp.]|nr:hypothetical protein [Thermogutta sp.]
PYSEVCKVEMRLPGAYCHRVFETHMVPYFAQFPIVEIDRSSAQFWASMLYRSDFARYGDQWDWRARLSYATYLAGLRNGLIVPKPQLHPAGAGSRTECPPGERPHPVVVLNLFCGEKTEGTMDRVIAPPLLEPKPTVRITTSSAVLPMRVTNPFIP